MLNRIELILKVSGLIILMSGVVLGYLDISGRFVSREKEAFFDWIVTSKKGLSVTEHSAKVFMKDFPPPEASRSGEITHITKNTFTVVGSGKLLNAGINYMYSDGTRTAEVATLEEVREWKSKTIYPLVAWILSLTGFLEVAASFVIEKVKVPGTEKGEAEKR